MSQWKVDPDYRRRLLKLQKQGANKRCVDCNAPNPQWASPKFGIFICLECAGIHRSLGVHISFVRSITMDQFKQDELLRMEKGGNEQFNEYMSSHGIDLTLPQKLKYDNPIAEDYKEKLTCLVEGREFVEPTHPDFNPSMLGKTPIQSQQDTFSDSSTATSRDQTPLGNRRSTPFGSNSAVGTPTDSRSRNEQFFAELGRRNQEKPDHLPPSQGGRYQGFGNTPTPTSTGSPASSGNNTLSLQNLQKDPLGTLTKGWGMFSSAVSKSFNDVNETVIKPGMQQLQSGELSEETKRAAAQFGQKFQETSQYGFQAFTKFTKNLQEQYYSTTNAYFSPETSREPQNPSATGGINTQTAPSGAGGGTGNGVKARGDVADNDEWQDF